MGQRQEHEIPKTFKMFWLGEGGLIQWGKGLLYKGGHLSLNPKTLHKTRYGGTSAMPMLSQ